LARLCLVRPRLVRRRLQPRRLAQLPRPYPEASSALLLHQPQRSRLVLQRHWLRKNVGPEFIGFANSELLRQRRRRLHSELLRLLQLCLRPRPLELPLPRLLHPRPFP